MITLDAFRRKVSILSRGESDAMRSTFVSAFIDTEHEWYTKHVLIKRQYSDGWFYEAYLWDSLKKPYAVTTEEGFFSELSQHKNVFVMWDIHSSQKIRVPDYWKFDKDVVINLSTYDLAEGITYLPNDIYIFDNSFLWTLVTTHEFNPQGRIYVSKRALP